MGDFRRVRIATPLAGAPQGPQVKIPKPISLWPHWARQNPVLQRDITACFEPHKRSSNHPPGIDAQANADSDHRHVILDLTP